MKKFFSLIILAFLITMPLLAQHNQNQNHQHSEHLEILVSEYLEMKEALVNDQFEEAKSSLQNFAEEVTSNDEMNNHPEHDQMHQAHHRGMVSAVEPALDADNIDQLRQSFDEISTELIKAVKNQNYDETLYIQFCPMADNGSGAEWLSKEQEIKNPFYGSMMQKCGSITETIN